MNIIKVQTNEQLAQCLDIRRAVFIDEQQVPEALEIDEQDVLGVGHHVLVLDQDGIAMATARYKAYDAKTAKIQRVAVRKEARGRDYGRQVMTAIEELAYSNGMSEVILDAQVSAVGFYRKLDYQIVSATPFLDAGIEHLRMSKSLADESLR
jgi:predicted GNAT family N-acyltransferase